MQPDTARLLDAVAQRVIASAEELTELGSAIGDADHGLNMKRGFEAVRRIRREHGDMPLAASAGIVSFLGTPPSLHEALIAALKHRCEWHAHRISVLRGGNSVAYRSAVCIVCRRV